MICPKCKKENRDGSRFCEYCGTGLAGTAPAGRGGNVPGSGMGGQGAVPPGRGNTVWGQGNPAGRQGTVPPGRGNAVRGQGNPAGRQGTVPSGQGNAVRGQGRIPSGQGNAVPGQNTAPFGRNYGAAPQMPNGRPKPPMDAGKRKILIGGIAGAAVLLLLILVLAVTHKAKIDLNDYVTVSFSGYDTRGTASIAFDEEAFAADLQKKAKGLNNTSQSVQSLSDIDWEELAEGVEDLGSYWNILGGVSWKLDRTENLSNGDKVKLTFTFDNEAAGKYKIKFVGKEQEISVSDLTPVKELDPFAEVTVKYSGTSPDAYAEIVNSSTEEALQSLDFSLSPESGIRKGDTVTVTVETGEEELLEGYGCTLKTTSREYTCDAVDEYVSALKDIDKSTMDSMKGQTKDVISSYFAGNQSELKRGKLKYEGCYLLSRKESDDWSSHNIVYVVYSTRVTSKAKSFRAQKVYLPVEFDNVIRYADGTGYVDLNSTSITGTTELSFGWWSKVSGYTTESTMRGELVSARKGEYNTESGGSLK